MDKIIHDAITGAVEVKAFTKSEIDDFNANAAITREIDASETAKGQAKAALLERLGITETEAQLLLA